MKIMTLVAGSILSTGLAALPVAAEAQGGDKVRMNVLEMKSVPEGHYLVNLQLKEGEQAVNIEVKGETAKCVNSSNPRFDGMQGKFKLIGNGVFIITFQNKNHTASQWWLFRPDGTAVVKEMPDRGEQQNAIPVADRSLERPKQT